MDGLKDTHIWMKKLGCINEETAKRLICEMSQINAKDKSYGEFPNDTWQIYVMGRDEHTPPHLHIINNTKNYTLRFDINTCKTIYEEGLSNISDISRNRKKWTDNPQNMNYSYEEISRKLKLWYKQPCTRSNANGMSNYEYAVKEWNDIYGERIAMCDYDDNLGFPKTQPQLKELIEKTMVEQGNTCDLNFIDTSLIKDMASSNFHRGNSILQGGEETMTIVNFFLI